MSKMLIAILFIITITIVNGDGRRYAIVKDENNAAVNNVNFDDAKSRCQDTYASGLATVVDTDDKAALKEAFDAAGLTIDSDHRVWIGLNLDSVGEFKWLDGTTCELLDNNRCISYWAEGEPNNGGGTEDCAHVWFDDNGIKANDWTCSASADWTYIACNLPFNFISAAALDDLPDTAAANDACIAQFNAQGASIQSRQEFRAAHELCEQLGRVTPTHEGPTHGEQGNICCLGGNDFATDGKWVWNDESDNKLLADTDTKWDGGGGWAAGQPHNGNVDEDIACVATDKWNYGFHDCVPGHKCYPICNTEPIQCKVTFNQDKKYGAGTSYGPFYSGDYDYGKYDPARLPNDAAHSMKIEVTTGAACVVQICDGQLPPNAAQYLCYTFETATTKTYDDIRNNIAGGGVSSFSLHPKTCTDALKSFDWTKLTDLATDKPNVDYSISKLPDTLGLKFRVEVDYEGPATNDDEGSFGVTYVLDFEDYNAHKDNIYEPGTCQNRVASDFKEVDAKQRPFSEWWTYSTDPAKPGNIGKKNTMAYPPPNEAYWTMQMKDDDVCGKVVYEGTFTWNQLIGCNNGKNAVSYMTTVPSDANNDITLSGVFYVNVVSPYAQNVDENYYRVYQLLSVPFTIAVSKTVYVAGEAGINVLTMSVIAVYKEKKEDIFKLVVLTESQKYLQLGSKGEYVFVPDQPVTDANGNPTAGLITSGKFTAPAAAEDGDTCLSNKDFICSQLWVIEASGYDCVAEGIDFSGKYTLKFDTTCRSGENPDDNAYCIKWLDKHEDWRVNGVAPVTHLTWRDNVCVAEEFKEEFVAHMHFFKTASFTKDGNGDGDGEGQHLFKVKEIIYVEIDTDFKTGTDDIFDSKLINVWICTFEPGYIPNPLVDPKTNVLGGCMDTHRDGGDVDDPDNPYYYHIFEAPADKIESFELVDTTKHNILRFYFKVPRKIARDTLFVHAQVEVTLATARRRRMLLISAGKRNQMGHFVGSIGITQTGGKHRQPVNEPEWPQPQQPQPQPLPQAPATNTWVVSLSSPWVLTIGALLAVVLTFNIIFMCYMNICNKRQRGRVSFNSRRRSGYSSVKGVDSEDFNESEANAINVVSDQSD